MDTLDTAFRCIVMLCVAISTFVFRAMVAAAALFAAASSFAAGEVRLIRGSDEFVYTDPEAKKRVTVYTYVPRRAELKDARILFVLHGHHRSAKAYRDDWAYHADRLGFVVVAPLFDVQNWTRVYANPKSRRGEEGKRIIEQPSFKLIEHLFDALRKASGSANERYLIYGFSEGGQFVHRLVLTMPEARYSRAVVGTPGWYTMPDLETNWPFGLKRTPTDKAALKGILERDVVLLLGGADTDPNHPDLTNNEGTIKQGPHRLARGQNFFRQIQARTAELHAKPGWRVQVVPGVAHLPKKMSGSAALALTEPPPK